MFNYSALYYSTVYLEKRRGAHGTRGRRGLAKVQEEGDDCPKTELSLLLVLLSSLSLLYFTMCTINISSGIRGR